VLSVYTKKVHNPACWAPSGDGEVAGGQGTMSNEQLIMNN